ncbi:MAG: hypothetical protein ACRCUY_10295 [Thermoguttaceae bacterium]
MMTIQNIFWGLLTATKLDQSYFRFARIQEPLDSILPLCIFLFFACFFWRSYRKDAAQLSRSKRFVLVSLRIIALFALLLYFLEPRWEHLVGSSRVAIMIDTSASMGIREDEISRLDEAKNWMQTSRIIERLLEKHEVAIYSFDKSAKLLESAPEKDANKEIAINSKTSNDSSNKTSNETQNTTDLLRVLTPDGEETALGDSLTEILQRERSLPLAGIILLSDGCRNSGQEISSALETAKNHRIPLFPIGFGQTILPFNVRIGAVFVPERIFPNDPFTLKVPVEMDGGDSSVPVSVEVWLNNGTEMSQHIPIRLEQKEVIISPDGITETDFELRLTEVGKHNLTIKIIPPPEDHSAEDDEYKAEIEVIDRKDRMLLFASTPSRDYQFLSSQIHRDTSMTLDVFPSWTKLNTSTSGISPATNTESNISQNAETVRDSFPATLTDMAQYDVVIAIDPNWRELAEEQINVLENWLARQGGGLIIIAGSSHQGDIAGWVSEPSMEKIRTIYPVDFLARQSTFEHRYHADKQPWKLKFTRAGDESDFLRPFDDVSQSRLFWGNFPGFFGFFAVKGVKPTATLLASSSSPELPGRDETGALFVEQFYGAGRVLYIGSGELWRLRQSDLLAFEKVVTRMIRFVSQGRLHQDSDRGSLRTDKTRYPIGTIVPIRITAKDPQLTPLMEPIIPIEVETPSGKHRIINATLDANVPGVYQGHVPLNEEGSWVFSVNLPGKLSGTHSGTLSGTKSEDDLQLMRTVQAHISDKERVHPKRDEPMLQEIAAKTGGIYYPETSSAESVLDLLPIRSQRAVPDMGAEERMMQLLLSVFLFSIFLEWTLRRLMRLA